MKKTVLLVLTFVAVLAMAGLVVAEISDNEATLNQIAGYRQWTRVNREPVQVKVATVDLEASIAGG
jgi:hypothetical protein